MIKGALALLFLAPSAAWAIPDNIWSHIETACLANQVPIKDTDHSWVCGAPVASSVPVAGILAGTIPVGVLLPAASILGVIASTALPATVVYTTGSYADPTWVTSLAASKLTGTVLPAVLPSTVAYLTGAAFTGVVTVGGVAVLTGSTVAISHVSGGSFSTGLSNGTTFQSFVPDAAISLRRLCATVAIAGVGGSGDTIRCNDAAGSGVSATLSAAAAAGTTTCSTGVVAIAYQGQVYCHLDTDAITVPLFNMNLEYTIP